MLTGYKLIAKPPSNIPVQHAGGNWGDWKHMIVTFSLLGETDIGSIFDQAKQDELMNPLMAGCGINFSL